MGRFSLPDERPKGLNAPVAKKALKLMSRVQVRVFKLTNGRVGRNWRIGAGFRKPVPTLLLEHVGRKSGTPFTTPLLFLDDPPNVVIVASVGGMRKNPQWFANLMAHPETRVDLPKQPRPSGAGARGRRRGARAGCGRCSSTSTPTSRSTRGGPTGRSPSSSSSRDDE